MRFARRSYKPGAWLVVSVLSASLFWVSNPAFSQTSFYNGKTILIIQGRRPGGMGDLRTRATMSLLSKFIPGKPTIVTQYMPGAGGRKAANHLYGKVRRNGLTIANIGSAFVSNGILGAPGVRYDVDKLVYLGSGNSKTNYVFTTRSAAGYDTLKKLQAGHVRVGTLSVGHDIYVVGRLFSWLMGLKNASFVSGYSGPELDLAVTRGEVDARAGSPFSIVRRSPDWIKKKQANFHAILEIPKGYRFSQPPFDKLPTLESFTKTDRERKILLMQRNFRLLGGPYLLPPGVPRERVETLRQAFRRLFKDPQLAKVWTKVTGEEYYPLLPEEQKEAVRSIPRSAEMLELFKKIAGAGPLPPR